MRHWRQKKRYTKKKHHQSQSHNDGLKDTTSFIAHNTNHNVVLPENDDGSRHRNGVYRKNVYSAQHEFDFKHRSDRCQDYAQSNNHFKYSSSEYRNYDKTKHKRKKSSHFHEKSKQNPKYLNCPQSRVSCVRSSNLENLSQSSYLIREKSDGMNVKCYITQNSVYFIDEQFNISMLTDVFYGSHGFISTNKVALFSGELIVSQRTNKYGEKYMFYRITDCIAFDGHTIANRNTSNRYEHIDRFMRVYTSKLREYAQKKNKIKMKKENKENKENGFEPGDDEDTEYNRLLGISTQLDNNYQYTRCIKDEIINLCRCNSNRYRRCDDQDEKDRNDDDANNILDDIELDVVSIVFVNGSTCLKATKKNLQKLSRCIQYNDDADKGEEGYYYSDPQTEMKTKSEGILFIPENNNYMMNRSGSDNEIQRMWKPIDLLTVDIEIIVQSAAVAGHARYEMNDFIDFDELNLYVYNEDLDRDVWFNKLDMGRNDVNDVNDGNTPFWNEWHLKQRSMLMNFVVIFNQESQLKKRYIVECNYDFNQKSWSLYRLKLQKKRPSSLKVAMEVIAQMEEYITINDLIQAMH